MKTLATFFPLIFLIGTIGLAYYVFKRTIWAKGEQPSKYSRGGIYTSIYMLVFAIAALLYGHGLRLDTGLPLLLGAIALIVRSFRPPLGFLQGLITVLGGSYMATALKMLLGVGGYTKTFPVVDLIVVFILLFLGQYHFKRKKK